jgi:hypothetical protein
MTMKTELIDRHTWFGDLDMENAQAIRDRIQRMLAGKRYTFVAVNRDHPGHRIDVRTDQRLDGEVRIALDGFPHIYANDTYGMWGFSTITEEKAPYVSFEGDYKIIIRQLNGYKEHLEWVIVVQDNALERLAAAIKAYRQWFDTCDKTLLPNWGEQASAASQGLDDALLETGLGV